MKDNHHSYIRNFCSCEKKALKKFIRDSNLIILSRVYNKPISTTQSAAPVSQRSRVRIPYKPEFLMAMVSATILDKSVYQLEASRLIGGDLVGSEMVWSGGEVTVPSQLYMWKWVAICLTANAVKLCPNISYVRFISLRLSSHYTGQLFVTTQKTIRIRHAQHQITSREAKLDTL